ncbi:hypothetical protein KQX54_016670 [Cotesia glomerata]|uniref:Uncharacterized protein n=1 Tax=Cotesia glomerata TaxID=32391 RepID=A0AAV7IFK0_COTGL|nr:hypothetical protein KQX54_016670 [Cotesia glomerata]
MGKVGDETKPQAPKKNTVPPSSRNWKSSLSQKSVSQSSLKPSTHRKPPTLRNQTRQPAYQKPGQSRHSNPRSQNRLRTLAVKRGSNFKMSLENHPMPTRRS